MVPSTDTHFAVPFAPIFNPASMLLHFEGAGGSTTITDSTGRHTLTATGAAQISNSWSRFGSGSATFDGISGTSIQTNGGGQDFAFGLSDFTIDLWINTTAPMAGSGRVYAGGLLAGGGNCPIIDIVGSLVLWRFNSGTQITGATAIVEGTTYHVAVTRSGTSTKLFINGVQEGATYVGSDILINDDNNNCPRFGSNVTGAANNYSGFMDEVRVIKGLAVWTANFTPPISPYTPPPP